MWSLHRCHRVKGYSLDLGKNLLRNQVKSCENYLARDGKKSQGTQHGREHPATVPVQIISSTRKLLDWGYLRTPGIPQMLLPIWCGGKNGSMKEGRMGIQVHYWHYINYIRGVIRGDRHRRATECELAHLNSQISPCVLSKAFGYSGPLVWDLASKETSCQIFHDLGGNLIWSKSISQEIPYKLHEILVPASERAKTHEISDQTSQPLGRTWYSFAQPTLSWWSG